MICKKTLSGSDMTVGGTDATHAVGDDRKGRGDGTGSGCVASPATMRTTTPQPPHATHLTTGQPRLSLSPKTSGPGSSGHHSTGCRRITTHPTGSPPAASNFHRLLAAGVTRSHPTGGEPPTRRDTMTQTPTPQEPRGHDSTDLETRLRETLGSPTIDVGDHVCQAIVTQIRGGHSLLYECVRCSATSERVAHFHKRRCNA